MRGFLILATMCWLVASSAIASPVYPALTGRVVDTANILTPGVAQQLTDQLASFEQQTGHQLVVVTVPSLNGQEIAEYGYQLGRHWGIGRQGKDDGVLLIVAVAEHKLRIEVGYGLEGTLTDTISSQIINTVMVPQFKAGNMERGIVYGTEAIISTLGGKQYAGQPQTQQGQEAPLWVMILFILFILFIRFRFGVGILSAGTYGAGWNSGGSSFRGGGGSFGGGGSSGSW